jgi:hypothetical protein
MGEACDQWRGMSALLHLVFKKSQTQNPRSGNGAKPKWGNACNVRDAISCGHICSKLTETVSASRELMHT